MVTPVLTSLLSQAREEGYKDGKAEGLGALAATGDAKTAFAGLMGYEDWVKHGKTYGFLSAVQPKSSE